MRNPVTSTCLLRLAGDAAAGCALGDSDDAVGVRVGSASDEPVVKYVTAPIPKATKIIVTIAVRTQGVVLLAALVAAILLLPWDRTIVRPAPLSEVKAGGRVGPGKVMRGTVSEGP